MKQLALVLAALVATSAFAQEIGTEITPTTPTSGVQNPPPPPPPSDPPPKGYVYKPKGQKDQGPGPGSASEWAGAKASAAAGDFGIRAGFGASGMPTLSSGPAATAAPVAAPSLGVAYFAGDAFKLLIDLGFGLQIANNAQFALSAALGFDYLFRTPADAMRPFFHFAGSFTMAGGGSNVSLGFGAQLGFGAEYFFSPSFSVNGRLLLSVPMTVNGNFVLGIFSAAPGVGATWYL